MTGVVQQNYYAVPTEDGHWEDSSGMYSVHSRDPLTWNELQGMNGL